MTLVLQLSTALSFRPECQLQTSRQSRMPFRRDAANGTLPVAVLTITIASATAVAVNPCTRAVTESRPLLAGRSRDDRPALITPIPSALILTWRAGGREAPCRPTTTEATERRGQVGQREAAGEGPFDASTTPAIPAPAPPTMPATAVWGMPPPAPAAPVPEANDEASAAVSTVV